MRTPIATLILTLFIISSAVLAGDENSTIRQLRPDSIAPALGTYSLGVATPNNYRWVHVAGQTGVRKDRTSPKDFATQARIAMANVKAILAEADMDWSDVVSFNIYMTHREDLEVWKTLGKELFGDARPAGTLVFVAGLVHPDWRIEIEATAAKKMAGH